MKVSLEWRSLIFTSAVLWAQRLMGCHRAAGYTITPPEFRKITCLCPPVGSPWCLAGSGNNAGSTTRMYTAHHAAPGCSAKEQDTQLCLCVGTGVGIHESMCRCICNCVINFMVFDVNFFPSACWRLTSIVHVQDTELSVILVTNYHPWSSRYVMLSPLNCLWTDFK